ncbi:MAG: nicotinate (nicotinamide) nucleotide adenylyltransferase, partial [Burkholderiales bacterium]|nr:nicotinate (nicotinamide) nucleotide adenylyltransferase [Opitutaceae bacterium]
RIGVLGGSFDPVHNGHLGVARAVVAALGLDRVLLMPAAQAPLRDEAVRATGGQRAQMLSLALGETSAAGSEEGGALEVSDIELRRGGVSYTVDTLRALRAERPGDEFTWVVGADQLARLGRWREPEELARLAEWAAYARPGYSWDTLTMPAIPGLRVRRLEPADGAVWDVSSSEVRARLARGESVAGLVPDKVIEYIRENGLYRSF